MDGTLLGLNASSFGFVNVRAALPLAELSCSARYRAALLLCCSGYGISEGSLAQLRGPHIHNVDEWLRRVAGLSRVAVSSCGLVASTASIVQQLLPVPHDAFHTIQLTPVDQTAELEHVVRRHCAALCSPLVRQRSACRRCHAAHCHHRPREQGALPLHSSILRPRAVGVRRSQRVPLQRVPAPRVSAAPALTHGLLQKRRQLGQSHSVCAARARSVGAPGGAAVAASRIIGYVR